MSIWPFPNVYLGNVLHAVDGDTIDVMVDLGFSTYRRCRFRIVGVNTPELRGGTEETKVAARAARDYTARLIGQPVRIVTHRGKSFDRYLADVYFVEDGEEKHLATQLIANGLGEKYPR